MIGNINKTKELLNKYNLQARKSFGQNFLIDQNILNRIIKSAELTKEMGVIEIGPGLGSLTEHLAINAKRVLAYEIDPKMIEILNEEFHNYQNIRIINKDILDADILSDINLYLNDCENIIVVANLPYYITTPIIFKFLSLDFNFNKYIFMVQKELASRFTGKPSTKDYNALSVLLDYKTITKVLFNVSPKCFHPEPKVDSAVIEIKEVKKDFGIDDEDKFIGFIKAIFVQRRKTVSNNLYAYYGISKDVTRMKLSFLSLSESARAEELDIEKIVQLYKEIKDSINC